MESIPLRGKNPPLRNDGPKAHPFDGAENLESWTVAASGNRPGSVLLSADGKSLYLSLVSPTVIFFR